MGVCRNLAACVTVSFDMVAMICPVKTISSSFLASWRELARGVADWGELVCAEIGVVVVFWQGLPGGVAV